MGCFVCVCVYACLLEYIRESIWKLEDLWELIFFSFHHVDSGYQTQINEAWHQVPFLTEPSYGKGSLNRAYII